MTTPADFSSKMAEIQRAMEQEEWGKAIHDLENIGAIPDKFYAVASNILFYLYISRNQYQKLGRLGKDFSPAKSKDSVSALLLFRDQQLEYPVELPANWTLDAWEQAIEDHALAGKLEPRELLFCLGFLSFLNRPRLLAMLHLQTVESGGLLDNASIEIVLRCYLESGWFAQARRFLWIHNLNNIAFQRFEFLIDRAEKARVALPESTDKFVNFLRYKFGPEFPAQIPPGPTA
jgi:hypothetical protein